MVELQLYKGKQIGNVLCIVEGARTEFSLLRRIFHTILNYSVETVSRGRNYQYKRYNHPHAPSSRVCVINAEESNIRHIALDNEFLDNLFTRLIEDYEFPVDRSAIYYLWDRDPLSNTDANAIHGLLKILGNAYDNGNYRQGALLLSYPSIESYRAQCFVPDCCFSLMSRTGAELKSKLEEKQAHQNKIDGKTVVHATEVMLNDILQLTEQSLDIDRMQDTNLSLFDTEQKQIEQNRSMHIISLLSCILLDLGIIEPVFPA